MNSQPIPGQISSLFSFNILTSDLFIPTGKALKTFLPKHRLKEQMKLIVKVKFSLTGEAVTKGFL